MKVTIIMKKYIKQRIKELEKEALEADIPFDLYLDTLKVDGNATVEVYECKRHGKVNVSLRTKAYAYSQVGREERIMCEAGFSEFCKECEEEWNAIRFGDLPQRLSFEIIRYFESQKKREDELSEEEV